MRVLSIISVESGYDSCYATQRWKGSRSQSQEGSCG
jgi:hypothetical protein